MNCREAEKLILIEREGASGDSRRAALETHLEGCPACRDLQAGLTAATQSWKAMDVKVALPDVEREWHAIRRRMRATEIGPRFSLLPAWLVPSLAAAAVAVMVFFIGAPWSGQETTQSASVARAEYVEVADESASTLVYVDEDSGWLVVWAVAPAEEAGS